MAKAYTAYDEIDLAPLVPQAMCEQHRDDLHQGVRAVVREFLLDWDVITRQLAQPYLVLERKVGN